MDTFDTSPAVGTVATTATRRARVAAQADVAARYGFALRSLARADGALRLCPHLGPAQLLRGHPAATPPQRAHAALALTRSDCPAEEAMPARRSAQIEQQAGLGAVEWAGWVPARDGAQLLVAREAETGARSLRRFEVYGPEFT